MESVSFTKEQMLEVTLKEPDDFLKVRETLSRIGVASRKEKNSINPVTFYTNRESITLYILKNFLHLMAKRLILVRMILGVETGFQVY